MEFKEGTSVYTADGDKIGDIQRFVLNPSQRKIIGLVVEKGFFFPEDRVVPTAAVNEATEERVTLKDEGDPEDFPRFEERYYVSPDEAELTGQYGRTFNYPVYYYPPMGTTVWGYPMYPPRAQPSVVERNIPEESVAIAEGANVYSQDGEHVGDVARVHTDEQSREVTHIIISQGLLFTDEKPVPVHWVESVGEHEVYLGVGKKSLERLPEL
jgi:uncharacterized protein YrrD